MSDYSMWAEQPSVAIHIVIVFVLETDQPWPRILLSDPAENPHPDPDPSTWGTSIMTLQLQTSAVHIWHDQEHCFVILPTKYFCLIFGWNSILWGLGKGSIV